MMCIETPEAEDGKNLDETQREELIENIMTEMWKFNQTYKLSSERPVGLNNRLSSDYCTGFFLINKAFKLDRRGT